MLKYDHNCASLKQFELHLTCIGILTQSISAYFRVVYYSYNTHNAKDKLRCASIGPRVGLFRIQLRLRFILLPTVVFMYLCVFIFLYTTICQSKRLLQSQKVLLKMKFFPVASPKINFQSSQSFLIIFVLDINYPCQLMLL